jgi:hypothetical protein
MTVQTIPTPPTTKKLIDPLDTGNNKSGFQRAHIVGDKFAQRGPLAWFRWILGSCGENSRVNGVLARLELRCQFTKCTKLTPSASQLRCQFTKCTKLTPSASRPQQPCAARR